MNSREAAEALGLSKDTVKRKARELGLGIAWGGSKGNEYSEADLEAIRDSYRRQSTPRKQRKRPRARKALA
jgi:hypothetical protein